MLQEDFFSRFNIDPLAFDRSGLKWSMMEDIAQKYEEIKPHLEPVAKYAVESLMKCKKVHSINYRIKDTDHLIEKIIRKVIAHPERSYSCDNFYTEITDLIGVRVLHLFKEDWMDIHSYMTENWDFIKDPIAYYRHGDPERILDFYKEMNCRIKEHPHGYRSVHYLVDSSPGKNQYVAEVQVRTLFEEAWGEIDHVVRYPYYADDELLGRLSSILNRLSADSDELGTYMRYMKLRNETTETEHKIELQAKNRMIENLRKQINELEIDKEKKSVISHSLDELENQEQKEPELPMDHPWLQSLLESPIFQTISHRIEEVVQSESFEPISITESDLKLLENASSEMLKILADPSKGMELLSGHYPEALLKQLEKAEENSADEMENHKD